MTEKILSIEEVHNHEEEYGGFVIRTDAQEIQLLISNQQQCCEDWGYLMTPDNVQEFVGATLLNVKRIPMSEVDPKHSRYSNVPVNEFTDEVDIFINVETDRGTLQFTAYNDHNGYYGHDVIIKSNQCNIDESI